MNGLIGLLMVSVAVEGVIEYLFAGVVRLKAYIPYISAVFGLLAAIGFGLDLFAILGITAAYPVAGTILTGLMVGRGSNYLNDFISAVRKYEPTATTSSAAVVGPLDQQSAKTSAPNSSTVVR